MDKALLLIVTTVPETLATILRHQPRLLAQRMNGHLDIALATSPGEECEDIARNEGLPVHAIRMTRGMSPLADLISLFAMMRLLWRLRPTVIHSYTPKAGLIAMLAGMLCRVPVRVHTFTGLLFPSASGLRRRLLAGADRLICACATQVIPEGFGVKHDLKEAHITAKPLRVIGHGNIAGVDTLYFHPRAIGTREASRTLADRLGLTGDDFIFSYAGRLNRDKGLDELVAAFRRLPERAHLLIAGELDRSAPIGQDCLDALNSHPRIHRLGFLSDIRPCLQAADVLVLPSYREGFPNTVLQAGAMERPAIVTDVNGSREIIEHGLNGWIVAPHDAAGLERAMRHAMNTPFSQLSAMGERARQRVAQRFDRQQHIIRLSSFYLECLAPSSSLVANKQGTRA